MDIVRYILVSAGMKFRNENKFRCGIPAYTGSLRALIATGFITLLMYDGPHFISFSVIY
jgi:hypothetical protein